MDKLWRNGYDHCWTYYLPPNSPLLSEFAIYLGLVRLLSSLGDEREHNYLWGGTGDVYGYVDVVLEGSKSG